MDILSHSLWSAGAYKAAANKKRKFRLGAAAFFGMAPDIFSFGIHSASMFLGLSSMPMRIGSEPEKYAAMIPSYIFSLYNISHSLVVFMAIFMIVWAVRGKPFWELGGWGMHILIDIPTHTSRFFPTPFLWPISDLRVNGFSWGEPWFMILNYLSLALFWVWLFWRGRRGA